MRVTTAAATVALLAATGIAGAAVASAASSSVPVATPIHVAAGGTTARVHGHLTAGGNDRYAFTARAGQTASFHLARSTSATTWTLVGPTGPAVHDARSSRQSDFRYTLPETGTYYVDVVSTRPATYDLSLSLPTATTPTTPEIRFAPGATSATVTGRLAAAGSQDYRFDARAGQRATVHFSTSGTTGSWFLVAPDGTPLHTDHTSAQAEATVVLPSTGTYRLSVRSGRAATYSLTLAVPRR